VISLSNSNSIAGLPASLLGGGTPPVNLDFVSTWDTTKAGSASNTVVLPLLSGGTYSGTINWGDGSISALSYANRTHVYASSGIYTITIFGTIEGWQFNNTGDKAKITDISNYGSLTITTNSAFFGCANLNTTATDTPIIATTDLSRTFKGCTVFNGLVDLWNMTGVTNIRGFFALCSNFNQTVNSWDTSSVIHMADLGAGAIDGLFNGAFVFNQPVDNWDTSNVNSLRQVFAFAYAFNQSVNSWDTSNVTNMISTFERAYQFNQPMDNWDVSNVNSLRQVFADARAFNQSVNSWDIGNVTNLTWVFLRAYQFNQPLSNWNTSNVTNMYRVFQSKTFFPYLPSNNFDQDISTWDINQVSQLFNFMTFNTMSTANYDALLIAWDAQGAMSFSGTAHFGSSKYTAGGAADAARTSLISKWGGIIDGGAA